MGCPVPVLMMPHWNRKRPELQRAAQAVTGSHVDALDAVEEQELDAMVHAAFKP